jgi:hypothetical protein
VLVKQQILASIRLIVMLAFATVLLALAHSSSASAQSANVLKISPVRSDVQVPAGTVKTIQVTLSNTGNETVTLHPIVNDFIAGDESGTPALILDEDQFAPTHSLKRYVTPLEDVTIPGRQAKTVTVVITIPSDADAGGYFGAIRFAPTDPDGGGQVNLSASVASLVLLTVPGDIQEELQLTDFAIKQDGRVGTNFRTPNNIQATVRFENKGNVQVGPFGRISVKQGNDVVYEADFNAEDPRDVVLPDSARRWDIPLDKIGSFGHYEVIATFTYGQTNQTIEVAQSFWVIPWWMIIAAIAAVVVLVGGIVLTILLIRRSRRRRAPRSRSSRRF